MPGDSIDLKTQDWTILAAMLGFATVRTLCHGCIVKHLLNDTPMRHLCGGHPHYE